MSARFDTEVMEHLEKLYQDYLSNPSVRPAAEGARRSVGEGMAFASPGQNPAALFRDDLPIVQSPRSEGDELADDVTEDLTDEKILQPRKLSLRVF